MAWSKPEILKLIEIWSNDALQAQLEGCRRNQDVYERIARELTEAGFERTYQQCRDKLKKLKGDYRKIKDKRGKTGEGRYPEWDYFDAMDAVLGHKPATEPTVTIDTLRDASEEIPDHSTLDTSTSSVTSETPDEENGESSASTVSTQRKKIKRSRAETIANEITDKLLDMQSQSDQLMIALEEKRLKFEEKQMEQDAQLRREEREFQMTMMQMMMGHNLRRPSPYSYGNPAPFVPSPTQGLENAEYYTQ